MSPITFTIEAEPASKANSRQLVTNRHTGKPMFIKSAKARAFERFCARDVPKLADPLRCDVKVTATIYYASRRPDLDESLILDGLQGRVIENDRQVKQKCITWGLDRALRIADHCLD